MPPLADGGYAWPDTIAAYGTVGLLVQGFDRFDKVWNKNGIQRAQVLVNGQPLYEHVIDDVPFPEGSRQINQPRRLRVAGHAGPAPQKLFVDDGNDLSMYTTGPAKGRLRVEAGKVYTVEVRAERLLRQHDAAALRAEAARSRLTSKPARRP